jgi:hypothetical protein
MDNTRSGTGNLEYISYDVYNITYLVKAAS